MRKRIVRAEPVELPPESWNVYKACAFLGVGKTKLYELIASGLPTFKIGGSRMFDPKDVARWYQEQKEA